MFILDSLSDAHSLSSFWIPISAAFFDAHLDQMYPIYKRRLLTEEQ